jgi:hypothetical protein
MDTPFYIIVKGDFAYGVVFTDKEMADREALRLGGEVQGPIDPAEVRKNR